MSSSNSLLKKCLQIQTNEQFAELFIEKSKMKTIVFSKKDIYIFNDEFKYYQPINGKFLDHVSEIIHKAFESLEENVNERSPKRWQTKIPIKMRKKKSKTKPRR